MLHRRNLSDKWAVSGGKQVGSVHPPELSVLFDEFRADTEWHGDAECRRMGLPTDLFFLGPGEKPSTLVVETCARCPVADRCREVGEDQPAGVWAGHLRNRGQGVCDTCEGPTSSPRVVRCRPCKYLTESSDVRRARTTCECGGKKSYGAARCVQCVRANRAEPVPCVDCGKMLRRSPAHLERTPTPRCGSCWIVERDRRRANAMSRVGV